MSSSLISRSPDLQRLRNEGFDLEVREGHLLVHSVPYLNEQVEVRRGTLAMALTLAADAAAPPSDHTTYFAGERPCDLQGQPLNHLINNSDQKQLLTDLVVNHYFSAKPRVPYPDYYIKVTTYVNLLCGHAQGIDRNATACTFAPVPADSPASAFIFEDTASARAKLVVPTGRLRGQRIAIVGLGGTGAYVLDLVAKTPVDGIHLFDGDVIHQHNVFRYPGAIGMGVLKLAPLKVDYFAGVYGQIHRAVVPHTEMVTEANVHELREFDYVFVCVDSQYARGLIAKALRGSKATIIDAGMGVHLNEAQEVFAVCRVTMVDNESATVAEQTLPMSEVEDGNLYGPNAQVGDLNCLNAFMAVDAWKRKSGYYASTLTSYFTTYTTASSFMAPTRRPS